LNDGEQAQLRALLASREATIGPLQTDLQLLHSELSAQDEEAAPAEEGGLKSAVATSSQGLLEWRAANPTVADDCLALASPAPPSGAWVPRSLLESEREARAADMRALQAGLASAAAEGEALRGHMAALREELHRAEWQKKHLIAQLLKSELAADEAKAQAQAEALRRRRESGRRREAEEAATRSAAEAAAARAAAAAAAAAAASPSPLAIGFDEQHDSWAGPASAEWYLPKILRLWAALHAPLLHRSRFLLGFRGRETFFFEAEHRRLAWMHVLQKAARGAKRPSVPGGAEAAVAGAAEALAIDMPIRDRR
jgi:hypothetical protein